MPLTVGQQAVSKPGTHNFTQYSVVTRANFEAVRGLRVEKNIYIMKQRDSNVTKNSRNRRKNNLCIMFHSSMINLITYFLI